MGGDLEADHAQAAGTASRVGLTGRIPVNALIDLATIEEDAQIGTIQGGFFFMPASPRQSGMDIIGTPTPTEPSRLVNGPRTFPPGRIG